MIAKRASRDDIINYVSAILTKGYTKKDAYLEFIDPWSKNPNQALAQFERKKEYQDIYVSIVQSDSHEMDVAIKRVRGKYAKLVEKNIDVTAQMLDDVKDSEVDKKAQVVRLANETIQALGVISNPPEAGKTTGLNKAGAVL